MCIERRRYSVYQVVGDFLNFDLHKSREDHGLIDLPNN
jgi:hypothetical protein